MANNLALYCRLCANTKLPDVGKFVDFNEHKTGKTYQKALTCLNFDFINWDDKNLPTTICKTCCLGVMRSYRFYNLAKKAQQCLENIFKIKDEKQLTIKEELIESNNANNLAGTSVAYVEVAINDTSHTSDALKPDIKSEVAVKCEPLNSEDSDFDNESDIDNTTKTDTLYTNDNKASVSTAIAKSSLNDSLTLNHNDVLDSNLSTIKCPSNLSTAKKGGKRIKPPRVVSATGFASWSNYGWACLHCHKMHDSMAKLREHSQIVHNVCYGFKCSECDYEYNIFNNFVEHVRQHREYLRYYCQYCNKKFEDQAECSNHAIAHWEDSHICAFCGEQFPDLNALKRHNVVFKRRRLPRKDIRKAVSKLDFDQSNSWESYEWACFYCYYKAQTVQELREHSKRMHRLCFTIKCADCLKIYTHFNVLVAHIRKHRPNLALYCQYCNYFCENTTQLELHIKHTHPKLCISCGECFADEELYFEHIKNYDVRISITTPQEDLYCKICDKGFKKPLYLKKHLATHKDRTKDYTCDECGSSFFNLGSLQSHKLTHEGLERPCLICKKLIKQTTFRNHVRTHFQGKDFSCDTCGKNFRKKANLKDHMLVHTDEANLKCEYCGKGFKRLTTLKTHLVQHTGEKPYACKVCDKTFGNWSNCNKHMLRKHNVSLGKTKQTEIGTVRIDEATGEVEVPSYDDVEVKQWVNKALEKSCVKRGRPKKTSP